MIVTRWDEAEGELTEATIRRKFDAPTLVVRRRSYPPLAAFCGATRAGTSFVLKGSCWMKSDTESCLAAGDVVSFPAGKYEMKVHEGGHIELMTVWDLSPFVVDRWGMNRYDRTIGRFFLKVLPHRGTLGYDPGDATLSEAMESAYRNGELRIHFGEDTWAFLPLSGGLSDIVCDVLRMLDDIKKGVYPFTISFLCSSFTALWCFAEMDGILTVHASWTAVAGVANGCDMFDAKFNEAVPVFVADEREFVTEWRRVLSHIMADLRKAGYGAPIVDDSEL